MHFGEQEQPARADGARHERRLMRDGEVWWVRFDGRTAVVLVPGADADSWPALPVVAPATAAQRRGFVLLTGAEAADERERERIVAAAGPDVAGVGAEIEVGTA